MPAIRTVTEQTPARWGFAQVVESSALQMLDDRCRVSDSDHAIRNSPAHYRTGADNGVVTDPAALKDHGLSTDPHILLDDHRSGRSTGGGCVSKFGFKIVVIRIRYPAVGKQTSIADLDLVHRRNPAPVQQSVTPDRDLSPAGYPHLSPHSGVPAQVNSSPLCDHQPPADEHGRIQRQPTAVPQSVQKLAPRECCQDRGPHPLWQAIQASSNRLRSRCWLFVRIRDHDHDYARTVQTPGRFGRFGGLSARTHSEGYVCRNDADTMVGSQVSDTLGGVVQMTVSQSTSQLGARSPLIISVIGCGYLGAVHAAAMAALGHQVIGIDVDAAKVEALQRGEPPFFEPRLADLVRDSCRDGRLRFTTDITAAEAASVHFICVGTPQKHGENGADLRYVEAAVTALLPYLKPMDIVVGKSTVPVGTAARLEGVVQDVAPDAMLAWNPEFLREGRAVEDTLYPDRMVFGLPDDPVKAESAELILTQVYRRSVEAGAPVVVTDYPTAELVKVAANSFLATKISFINAMAELCEATGADVTQLANAIGHDPRIGRQFLNAGLGFGGGCLPKDIRAFMARAGELGADQALTFLREVDSINMRRRVRMVDLAREVCGGSIVGRRVAVLGAAFKPESDDVRDSPALNVAAQMALQGAQVVITDPRAIPNASRLYPDLKFVDSVEEASYGAELVLLLTEWKEYVGLDPSTLKKIVAEPRILDGRNILDPQHWRDAGWNYRALGRP